jgi:hypothetical protein
MIMTKKFGIMTGKLVVVIQILALTLLASCAAVGASANVCHATGDAENPYEEITIDSTELINEHRVHSNDIFPVPVGGCPASLVIINNAKIAICHVTGSETNPYNEITVSVNGLNGHGRHAGDIIPVPEDGCPTSLIVSDTDEITVCHATGDEANPYEEITVTDAELNVHLLEHPNDIHPVPVTGCPASPVVITDGKVTLCHATNSRNNPYNEITVSVNGLNGHGRHEGDIFPVSEEEGCPANLPSGGMVTICHATGSEKNPYIKMTVNANGLNGHDKHAGDIIPVPAGGCPTTRP